jgi:hypothetical protein
MRRMLTGMLVLHPAFLFERFA